MADDEIRKLERELLAEGHEKIVRWVQGRLSMLTTTQPIPYRQDAPLFVRVSSAVDNVDLLAEIHVPRNYRGTFRCTGITFFVDCDAHDGACSCAVIGRASLRLIEMSGRRHDFPIASIAKNGFRSIVKTEPGLPGMFLNAPIDIHEAQVVVLELRTVRLTGTIVLHGHWIPIFQIPDPNLVDPSRPRREPLDLEGPVMGGPLGSMTP